MPPYGGTPAHPEVGSPGFVLGLRVPYGTVANNQPCERPPNPS
jgi:hypothetical protein